VASGGEYANGVGFLANTSIGDIDGDGFEDIIAAYSISIDHAAIGVYAGGPYFSGVRAYGLPHGMSPQLAVVASVGDMSGDGYADIAVGNSGNSVVHPYRGSLLFAGTVWLFTGGASAGSPALMSPARTVVTNFATDFAWRMDGAAAQSYFGYSVTAAGDLDADGADDLLLASYIGYGIGYTYVVYGPISAAGGSYLTSDADATLSGIANAVAPAGDVNADGYDDLWAGGSSLYLFHGTPR
jgi:hypothetical protein